MSSPSRRWRFVAPLLFCFGFVAPAGAVDLVGRTTAVFAWSAAPGQVDHYLVERNHNGEGFEPVLMMIAADERRVGIAGEYGDTFQIRVQAVGRYGQKGPFSKPSVIVRFVAPPPPGTDLCPNDPYKTEPGICGCGTSDLDSDSDGTPNCHETCDTDRYKTEPGICGCGTSDRDSDSDGTPDCVEDPAEPLDFNGDGSEDLLIRNPSTGEIEIGLLGDSSPAWIQADPLDPKMKIVGNADYDGNGYADLLALDPETGVLELRLLENGWTVDTGGFRIAPGSDVVGSADYDGNGFGDFLVRRQNGELDLWSLRGKEVLGGKPIELRAANPDEEILGSGDYDGDGWRDTLWQAYGSLFVLYLDLDDPAQPRERSLTDVPRGSEIIATGDYDGDGVPDLLLSDTLRGGLRMYLVKPRGVIVQETGISNAIPWTWNPGDYGVVGSADFDGDGFCDVALRHESGELLLLFLQGTRVQAVRRLDDVPQSWRVEGVGLGNPARD